MTATTGRSKKQKIMIASKYLDPFVFIFFNMQIKKGLPIVTILQILSYKI